MGDNLRMACEHPDVALLDEKVLDAGMTPAKRCRNYEKAASGPLSTISLSACNYTKKAR
jgi:hypothetical protein